ncbi:hypothetical protein B0H14DRAFT_3769897, partial [Mycena olivaceomarginata]
PWAVIETSLEAATPPVTCSRTASGAAEIGDVNIGDFAVCHEGSLLRYIFYDFVTSLGINSLTRNDKYFTNSSSRPLLGHTTMGGHASSWSVIPLGSFKVCFLATLELGDSVFTALSIPRQEFAYFPYRVRPLRRDAGDRRILPMPVVRSHLVPIRRTGYIREQLHYGQLERAKKAIQEKIALFTANHEAIRMKEIALLDDPNHPANMFKTNPRAGLVPMYNSRFIPSRVQHYNNIQWVLKHAREDIVAASRYLSSVDHPSLPFYLLHPFYSALSRATRALVCRPPL